MAVPLQLTQDVRLTFIQLFFNLSFKILLFTYLWHVLYRLKE